MEAFLPSEVGRLIYGYLFQQCGEKLAEEFLNSCDSMQECRLLQQKCSKRFHSKVQDLSLQDILDQYSVLCSLIFQNTTDEEPLHHNILSLLQKLLEPKLSPLNSSNNEDAALIVDTYHQASRNIENEQHNDSVINEMSIFSPSISDNEDSITHINTSDPKCQIQSDSAANAMKIPNTVSTSTGIVLQNISFFIEGNVPDGLNEAVSSEKSDGEDGEMEKIPIVANDIIPKELDAVTSETNTMIPESTVVGEMKRPTENFSATAECTVSTEISEAVSTGAINMSKTTLKDASTPRRTNLISPKSTSSSTAKTIEVLPVIANSTEATSTKVTNLAEISSTTVVDAPVKMVSTGVDSVQNIFEELSFVSECRIPAKFDDSVLSEKSTSQPVHNVESVSSKVKSTPYKSKVLSTNKKKIIETSNAIEDVNENVIEYVNTKATEDTNTNAIEYANTNTVEDELPWDLKLRQFIAHDSSVSAHVTKRKPKDLRSKKRKETPKKRKYNDLFEEEPTLVKKVKSDFEAADAAVSRPQLIAVDISQTKEVDPKSTSSRRRRHTNDEISLDHDQKRRKTANSKTRNEKTFTEFVGAAGKSDVSMTDIIDFSEYSVEKKGPERVEKPINQRNKKQEAATAKQLALSEPKQSTSVQKTSATLANDLVSSSDRLIQTKSEKVQQRRLHRKKQEVVDPRKTTSKESKVSPAKKSKSACLKELAAIANHQRGVVAENNRSDAIDIVVKNDINKNREITVECLSSDAEKSGAINDSNYDDDDLDFEMVLEISSEFILFSKPSRC